jgi:hypothetical protein
LNHLRSGGHRPVHGDDVERYPPQQRTPPGENTDGEAGASDDPGDEWRKRSAPDK